MIGAIVESAFFLSLDVVGALDPNGAHLSQRGPSWAFLHREVTGFDSW
jgi:hypothetical protein